MDRTPRSARLHPSVVFRPATARSVFFKSSFIIPVSAPEDSRARSRTMERGGATFREMSPVPLHDAAGAMVPAGSGEDRRLTHFSRSPSASSSTSSALPGLPPEQAAAPRRSSGEWRSPTPGKPARVSSNSPAERGGKETLWQRETIGGGRGGG